MATYEYDEAGIMAAYFLITFLALILVPLTLSGSSKKSAKPLGKGCECQACQDQRKRISKQERGSILIPNLSTKTYLLIGGWSLFAFICYKVSNTKLDSKIYDPFEILGIKSDLPEKEIKSHFKQLSRIYHPDKVKTSINQTIEEIQNKFVEITKAYKSLTDPVIRENWIKYNNPDGPQRMSMGIALPKWVIEGKNNIWVLGVYGLLFGIGLPALVGKWWFGSRQKTKDGINARSAAAFFKSLREESSMEDVVGTLGKVYQWDFPGKVRASANAEIERLAGEIEAVAGDKWVAVCKVAKDGQGEMDEKRLRALVLLYAHWLRIDVQEPSLLKEQAEILLQTPALLSAFLNITLARNWLLPTLSIMRLHAYLAQALPPFSGDSLRFTQLPGIKHEDIEELHGGIDDVVRQLEQKGDERKEEVEKAISRWGRVEIVDAYFKVIGERIITPSSMINMIVKLRISPPTSSAKVEKKEPSVDETKRIVKYNEEKDDKFLISKVEVEELADEEADLTNGPAHAPYWPGERKPSWWVVLADDKTNRVVVPPFKVTDIPYSRPDSDRDYRSYKQQFQGPPNTGLFTWKIYLVSDTFVGEEATVDITLKVEDPPANEVPSEDEISDPDEDTLAGQMAAMRGGSVKKQAAGGDEDSDEESGTDDDDKDESDSSSSDSD